MKSEITEKEAKVVILEVMRRFLEDGMSRFLKESKEVAQLSEESQKLLEKKRKEELERVNSNITFYSK